MYSLTEEQINYIINDIERRGITIEGLRNDILDHVCCLIETEYDGEVSFEEFYSNTIRKFYKSELREIESETIFRLTFKNYVIMKKAMIFSGVFSIITFLSGSVFKIMHWPAAGMLLVLAIVSATLVFLPLMFVFKSRQEHSSKEKLILALGSAVMILFSIGVLCRVQHWPGAMILWISAITLSFFLFIPLYFFNGIKKAETKVNTILFTVLMVLGTGVQFAMINTNPPPKQGELKMYGYLKSDELIERMRKTKINSSAAITEILNECDQIKQMIVQNAIGQPVIPADFEKKDILMEEGNLGSAFFINNAGANKVISLKNKIGKFNANVDPSKQIPVSNSIFDAPVNKLYSYSNSYVLNNISQIEMYALLAE